MDSRELRTKFLEFFKEKGHTIIPSASLVPENDPTVLFTTAGMHPLVPYLLWETHPGGTKLANIQKCIRTGDIDEVGDATHHTFFEMLGNWSLGDYFRKEAIEMSWEFLTSPKWLGLDKNKIAVSVFAGDDDAPFDKESHDIWLNLGVPEKRIAKLPKDNNWWGLATGPCGPDTEMFYWVGNPEKVPGSFNDDNDLWVEIWNDVFMEYNKTADGKYKPLVQKNVDTGMGIERILSAVNGFDDDYETELFLPIIKKIEEISGKSYKENDRMTKSMRIMADHLKAATFILSEKLEPSNVERGYVLRRLIRRAVKYGKQLGINEIFTFKIAEAVIGIYKNVYPELNKNKDFILNQLIKEEEKFAITLKKGLKEFEKGTDPFILFSTYGFPIELTQELAKEKGKKIDIKKFEKEFKKHQELSRAGAEQKFKGGMADHSEQTTKYHTATHLLLAAMREIINAEIYQKGSNITAERLRFDFNYPEKLTEEQIKQIENLVNKKIKEDLPVEMIEMPKAEAFKIAKISFDPSKYGDIVKVYKIGDFSIELCGGPHIDRTGILGNFKIIKEESSSAGVRRIKAVLN